MADLEQNHRFPDLVQWPLLCATHPFFIFPPFVVAQFVSSGHLQLNALSSFELFSAKESYLLQVEKINYYFQAFLKNFYRNMSIGQ